MGRYHVGFHSGKKTMTKDAGSTPPAATIFLSGPAMAVGAQRKTVRDLPGLEAFFAAQGLPHDPMLLGMDGFHAAARGETVWSMATAAAAGSLANAGLAGGCIDTLILCGTALAGPIEQTTPALREMMRALELDPRQVAGVTYGRCTSLMAGIRMACALVAAGMDQRVLVVTADLYRSDDERLQSFALFSDGAAASVIGASKSAIGRNYRIRAIAAQAERESFDIAARIAPGMVRAVNRRLESDSGTALADLAAVLPSNVFQPVAFATEAQAGARNDALFLENIPLRAHCFAADPIINIVDREARRPFAPGDRFLFGATVPGQRICAIAEVA
jgi:3-oxoacyl-[acyl-carrier-protein] synthase-3